MQLRMMRLRARAKLAKRALANIDWNDWSAKTGVGANTLAIGTAAAGVIGLAIAAAWPETPKPYDKPLTVAVWAQVKEKVDEKEISRTIDLTHDHHAGLESNKRRYDPAIHPEPGYRLISASFDRTSGNKVDQYHAPEVAVDGSSASMSFRLKAGPTTDRYRGWMKGTLRAVQQKVTPAHEEHWDDAMLVRPGRIKLEGKVPANANKFVLRDEGGLELATFTLGERVQWDQWGLVVGVIVQNDDAYLVVEKSEPRSRSLVSRMAHAASVAGGAGGSLSRRPRASA